MQEIQETYHAVLAKSYIVYFIAAIGGLFVDNILPIKLHIPYALPIALVCFALGPALMIWAQFTSRYTVYHNGSVEKKRYFGHGPYKYLRNPTQLGLLILVMGYTILMSSLIFFAITLTAYILSNIFFRKYEQLLEAEFGRHYIEYKSKVKKVL